MQKAVTWSCWRVNRSRQTLVGVPARKGQDWSHTKESQGPLLSVQCRILESWAREGASDSVCTPPDRTKSISGHDRRSDTWSCCPKDQSSQFSSVKIIASQNKTKKYLSKKNDNLESGQIFFNCPLLKFIFQSYVIYNVILISSVQHGD